MARCLDGALLVMTLPLSLRWYLVLVDALGRRDCQNSLSVAFRALSIGSRSGSPGKPCETGSGWRIIPSGCAEAGRFRSSLMAQGV